MCNNVYYHQCYETAGYGQTSAPGLNQTAPFDDDEIQLLQKFLGARNNQDGFGVSTDQEGFDITDTPAFKYPRSARGHNNEISVDENTWANLCAERFSEIDDAIWLETTIYIDDALWGEAMNDRNQNASHDDEVLGQLKMKTTYELIEYEDKNAAEDIEYKTSGEKKMNRNALVDDRVTGRWCPEEKLHRFDHNGSKVSSKNVGAMIPVVFLLKNNRKPCSSDGCTSYSRRNGVCVRHGAARGKCSFNSGVCKNVSVKKWRLY